MITNQWYAILPSKKVKADQIVSAKRLNLDLALFRNSKGEICCVVDQCTHRGAALSIGKVKGDCIQCPFHGLEFDKNGKCTFIPANGKASTADISRYNVKHYLVKELNGIIYLWYGEAEEAAEKLPFFYDQIDESYSYSEIEDHWNSHYSRCIENQLDVVHVPIVHYNTIGKGNKTLISGPKVLYENGILQTSANNEVDNGQKPKSPDECVIKDTNLNFIFPNIWLNHISSKIKVLIYFAPVDDENTILYIRFYCKLTKIKAVNSLIAFFGKFANKIIERQDKRVVITQKPKASSYKSGEKLLAGDGPIIQYRNLRDELKNNQNLSKTHLIRGFHSLKYDAIIIGGGLSGLTAASLLAKRGLSVAVVEKSYNPGGSCGIFRRGDVTFDQGAAMLYGFGDKGFNAHRFVFNCLEEPIDMIRHDLLYCVNFKGIRIRFWADVDRFADELSEVFPSEKGNIHRFYRDMATMYRHVMVESPSYNTADETDGKTALKSMLKHPVSYVRFLGYLNKSAKELLQKYFSDPEIFKFFDKLTSTYCYATVEEAPAVLAAVMFVDNHVGGSYYPAGSTLFVPGKLEKVIEEHGGDMLLEKEALSLIFKDGKPAGVKLDDGSVLYAPDIIYSGTVWNLYGKLIDPAYSTQKKREWVQKQAPTYPSVVLYAVVDRNVIPEDTAPIEMLVGNPDKLDESEVTAYILSIDDKTLCKEDEQTVVAIGPTFENWDTQDKMGYKNKKQSEQTRLIGVLEKRFPGFEKAVRYAEVATPRTIERYTMKNGGAVAGPKQMLGQHMFRRIHTRTEWDNLFCCGESTVMGTGTPTVTTSGLSAANALLKKLGKEPYVYQENMKNFVRIVEKPFTADQLYDGYGDAARTVMRKAMRCRLCEHPTCTKEKDIRGIMRRVAVGNFKGAKKLWLQNPTDRDSLEKYEKTCIRAIENKSAVEIQAVIDYLQEVNA